MNGNEQTKKADDKAVGSVQALQEQIAQLEARIAKLEAMVYKAHEPVGMTTKTIPLDPLPVAGQTIKRPEITDAGVPHMIGDIGASTTTIRS